MGNSYLIKSYRGISYVTFKRLEQFPFLIHGFSFRLNDKEKQFYNALNIFKERVLSIKQIHSSHILIIEKKIDLDSLNDFRGDAIITNQINLPIAVRTADCIPIIIFDPKKKIIAIVHAGRKGTLLKITKKVIKKLKEFFGANPSDVLVGLGPSIKACCYEVGENVIEVFKKEFIHFKRYIKGSDNNKFFLDLGGINYDQLLEEGVKRENILIIDLCTCCHYREFFSYRRNNKEKGRMINIAMLADEE